jgi:hypothetical protein
MSKRSSKKAVRKTVDERLQAATIRVEELKLKKQLADLRAKAKG